MPSSSVELRVRCGEFYWTFLFFMGQRQLPGSKVRGVRFVPYCADFCSAPFLNIKTECALFFFKHLSFKRTEKATRGARFGTLTALFVGIFLAHFLLQCMDVESNPGPRNTDRADYLHTNTWIGPWPQKDGLFRNRSHFDAGTVRNLNSGTRTTIPLLSDGIPNPKLLCTSTHDSYSAAFRKIEEDLEYLSEDTNRRLNELKYSHTALSRSMTEVQTWCHSLHVENSELKDGMNQLSTSKTHQLQDTNEYRRMTEDNITVLYNWCRSLQKENDKMKIDVDKLVHHSKNQTQSSNQSQGGSVTVTPDASSDMLDWCQSIQTENDSLKEDVKYLSSKCEVLENQCGNLLDWNHHFSDKSDTIDEKLEKLEAFSRACNIKLYNVFEGKNENASDCVRQVVQLLNRFYPSKTWSTEDVDKAYRLGPRKKDSLHPRPIIATMHRWRDKLLVLQDKGGRKEMADTLNVRVATDLTDRQNNILQEEKQAGKQAFFYNGRLHYNTLEDLFPANRLDQDKRQSHRYTHDRRSVQETDKRNIQQNRQEDTHYNKDRQEGRHQHKDTQQDTHHHKDRQQDMHHHEERQNRHHQKDREQDRHYHEDRRDRYHHEDRHLHEDRHHHENRQSEEQRKQHTDEENRNGQNSHETKHQQENPSEYNSTDNGPVENRSQDLLNDRATTAEPSCERHAHDIRKDTNDQLQEQTAQTDVDVPDYYSVNEFPPLRREPAVTKQAQPTTKKRQTSPGQPVSSHSSDIHIPVITPRIPLAEVQSLTLDATSTADVVQTTNTVSCNGLRNSLNSPENMSSITAPGATHADQGCVQSDMFQQSTEDDVLTSLLTPGTPV